jgi:two-component sensor histidine kinase
MNMANNQILPYEHAAYDPLLLVEELEHRVANEYALAMSSIDWLASGCDKRHKSILAQASHTLRDYATVHRALTPPRDTPPLYLYCYLQKLCAALRRACLADRCISLILHETSVVLESRRAWLVGLILSELITNAARHGKWAQDHGVIEIEIVAGVGSVDIWVSDNGTGTKGPRRGHGTNILEALTHELGGHIHREFRSDGTTTFFTFPQDLRPEFGSDTH